MGKFEEHKIYKTLNKYKLITFFVSFIGTLGGGGYIAMLVVKDTAIYKKVEEAHKITKENKADINTFKPKIKYIFNYVKKQQEDKRKTYQVGLRFKTLNNKLYFRDHLKEFREIKENDLGQFYRDENDNKIYINYRGY